VLTLLNSHPLLLIFIEDIEVIYDRERNHHWGCPKCAYIWERYSCCCYAFLFIL